jgi:hypothetical protein
MNPEDVVAAAKDRLEPELPRFVGLTPVEGEALAAELEVTLRVIEPGGFYTMDFRTDRVSADLEDGRLLNPRLG